MGYLNKIMVEFGEHVEVTLATYDTSSARNHLGAMVLDASKRILFRVLNLCNSLHIPVYYVDTD